MKKRKLPASIFAVLALCLLGSAVLCFPGYRFSAGVIFGVALIVLFYQLLEYWGQKHPKAARCLRRWITGALCILLLAAAVTGVLIIHTGCGSADEDCDYLIVLGAGVNGTVPSLSLRERLDATYDYLQRHPATVAILSGGQGSGEDITEALCMFQYLTAKGISPDRLIQEDQATSTQENLAFSTALIPGLSNARIGILSSEYHLLRARLIAREQGLEPVLVSAKTTRISLRLNYYMREVAGIWYYILLGG